MTKDQQLKAEYFSLPHIDMSIFEKFDMPNVASWSQIELWCALNGVDIDNNLFCFFLCGMIISSNIKEMMIDVISNSDICNEAMNKLNTIKCLVSLTTTGDIIFSNNFVKSEVFDKWLSIYGGYDLGVSRFTQKDLFSILGKIDKKCPLLLIKYYDKNKQSMYFYDRSMVEFILRLTEQKAKYSQMFQQVYQVMLQDKKKYENIKMFMN